MDLISTIALIASISSIVNIESLDLIDAITLLSEITTIKKIEVIESMPDPTPRGSEGVAYTQESAGAGTWQTPTNHSDPDSDWSLEARAYDDDTDTQAICSFTETSEWLGPLELTVSEITANKLRFWCDEYDHKDVVVNIDVFRDGVWVNVYEETLGASDYGAFIEVSFSQGSVTKVRVRVKGSADAERFYLYEVDVWEVSASGGELITSELMPLTLVAGDKDVTASATPEALGSGVLKKGVYVQAKSDNTQSVYVGDASSQEWELGAGDETPLLRVDNLNDVYVKVSVNGEGVAYIGS